MPFVKYDRRVPLLVGDVYPEAPGEWCFLEYWALKQEWNKERRWTTADRLCQETFGFDQQQSAKFLAFLEFYIREIHPYENEMVEKNGNI